MIVGAHSIIYSKQPEADRAFLRDALGLPGVDVGEGWLIFGLPPAEVAVHPSSENDVHELYFMCDDITGFVGGMKKRGIACGPVLDRGWGLLTELTLPGGGKLGVYQPRHARPEPMAAPRSRKGARRGQRKAGGKKAPPRGRAKAGGRKR
jgi:hypothetical protein